MAFHSRKLLNYIPNANTFCVFLLMLVWWFLIAITISPLLVVCIPTGMKQGIMCKEVDRQALLTLKAGLVDEANRLSSWSDNNPNCCNWKGVSCSNWTGHVLKLSLGNPFQDLGDLEEKYEKFMLEGEISSSLLKLKYLEYLDLSLNNFSNSAKIPAFLGSLTKLRYLNLSSSSFSGFVPPYLGNLSSLQYLDLGGNYGLEAESLQWLTGMSSLEYLNLDLVSLSKTEGADDWLKVINMLPMLLELHFRGCGLSNLPMSINHPINFTSSLSILDLSYNDFSSSLSMPPWLFNLTGLVDLQLSYCSLRAPFIISHDIGKLVKLQQLDLSHNRIGGQLPVSLGNLTNLVTLNLGSNLDIEGRMPMTFGYLCKLRELDMGYNKLEGEIDEFVDGLARCSSKHGDSRLETLDLSSNKLFGALPISLGSLLNLVSLDVSDNSFWGSIPTRIGSLTALKNLYLHSNKMNGTIAESIGELSELEELDLSGNQWRGQMLNESHFEKHTKLRDLGLATSSTSDGNLLVMNVTEEWIPPFRSLVLLQLDGVKIPSKKFPSWTRVLSELGDLSLQGCDISGSVPTEFWESCPNISHLYLSDNAISIRTTFKNMERLLPLVPAGKLKFLVLTNNSFSDGSGGDKIPSNIDQLAPSLSILELSSNSISGEIPRSICQLKNLFYLSLRNNMLSGELIRHQWENMISLMVLDLSNNSLAGQIPQSIGHLGNLHVLSLHDNNLEGEIPAFTNLYNLRLLDLGGNKLTGNIPSNLANQNTEMLVFRLRGNVLCGTIPLEFCLLSRLQTLDLAHNNFQGTIPWCLGNLSTSEAVEDFRYFTGAIKLVVKAREYKYNAGILRLVHLVDLSHNNLSGSIPQSLMKLTAMQTLNLSMNHLSGEIPLNIGVLKKLETLDLSQNQLSGPIPQSLSELSFLNSLNLSHNNLSGRIPSSRQLQTLDTSSSHSSIYDGNPLLCGVPLPTQCHQEEGDEKVEHGKKRFDIEEWGFILSIVLGFAVGFWGVCGSLVLKSSWRQAYFGYLLGVKEKIIVAAVLNVACLRRKMGISE